jgi:type I restriction enzyme, S subunit
MDNYITKIGKVHQEFGVFKLRDILIKNDAGDWGDEPNEKNTIGVLRSTNFTNQGILDTMEVAYRTLKPQKSIEKLLKNGEIIIERSGGSDNQPVGRVSYINEEIALEKFAFANFIQRIALNETVDSKFVYYCLQQMYEMGITASMQYQTTGIRNLDWKLYTKTLLPYPKPDEQTAIASILSKVDEAIQATQNSIKATEKLKKGLMQNLLTGKLKPDGTWRTKDEFIKVEKFGNVPVGWETTLFGKKIVVQYGKSQKEIVSETGNIPIYGTGGIIEYGNVALFSKESILIGRKGTIDKPFYLNNPFWAVDTTYYVESFEEGNIKYLFYLLQTKNLKSLNEATGVPSLTRRTLNRQRLILPPNEVQNEIVKKIDTIDDFIHNKQTKVQKLQRLKKSLMQNLLTGKMRVDVDEINIFLKNQ